MRGVEDSKGIGTIAGAEEVTDQEIRAISKRATEPVLLYCAGCLSAVLRLRALEGLI